MSAAQWVMALPVGAVIVYFLARLITAAYFRSKADYERGLQHGKR